MQNSASKQSWLNRTVLGVGLTSLFSDWSPDGLRIAIDSDRFNNGTDDVVDIFTMKADGSDFVRLTSHAGFNGEPDYSPDGARIAFESDRGVGFPLQGIYLTNASDGSNVQRQRVHDRVLQSVSHVETPCHVGRRDNDGISRLGRRGIGNEQFLVQPELVPLGFDRLRLVHFSDFGHWI